MFPSTFFTAFHLKLNLLATVATIKLLSSTRNKRLMQNMKSTFLQIDFSQKKSKFPVEQSVQVENESEVKGSIRFCIFYFVSLYPVFVVSRNKLNKMKKPKDYSSGRNYNNVTMPQTPHNNITTQQNNYNIGNAPQNNYQVVSALITLKTAFMRI